MKYYDNLIGRHFMETNHLFSLQVGNNRVWDYVRDNYVHRLLQSEGDGKVREDLLIVIVWSLESLIIQK